jgi:hypothetical protein
LNIVRTPSRRRSHAKLDQNVRAATTTGNGAVAVLHDRHARRGRDQSGGRADIECAYAVAACATGIQKAGSRRIQADHVLSEKTRGSG